MNSLALDPNIFRCFMYDINTLKLLIYFIDKLQTAKDGPKIARDENRKIKEEYQKEYLTLIEKEVEENTPTVASKFLSDLLSNWLTWTDEKPVCLDKPDAISLMTENGCSINSLESVLIGLATNSDVTLIATNLDISCQQTRYIIHNESLIRELRNNFFPDLLIVYATFAQAFLEAEIHSNLFEERVANWVENQYKFSFRRVQAHYKPPYLIEKGGAGEVDIYAAEEETNIVRILVGECKLRMPLDGVNKLVNLVEMEQLVKKVEAVKEHESKRWKPNGCTTKVFGMFVSNAIGITQEAAQLAKKSRIDCYRAEMSDDWYRYTDWRIKTCSQLPMVNPE